MARVTELSATSDTSFEDAIKVAIDRATQTLRGVRSAWVKEQEVQVGDNGISGSVQQEAEPVVVEVAVAVPCPPYHG